MLARHATRSRAATGHSPSYNVETGTNPDVWIEAR